MALIGLQGKKPVILVDRFETFTVTNKASFFFLFLVLFSCGGGNSTQTTVQNTNTFDACQFDSCKFSE
tara:strand:+ start:62 stop:265 length:204 start_codon:yes stop_codon:yes gene_type:complete